MLEDAVDRASTRPTGTHRLPPPPSALRGRIVVAAVAVGAFAAAGAGQTLQALGSGPEAPADEVTPLANAAADGAAAFGVGGTGPASPQVLPVAKTVDPAAEAQKLTKSARITEDREAAEAEAKRPKYARPANGDFTSGFGGRWGEMHYGIDIAGPIGTPILSAADGVVIEAGQASGFGLWVKVEHPDGTVTVYGHVDTYSVRKGQVVQAGEQIARMGNRGFSTGPHLHFEVWNPAGKKINPLDWLNSRGITV
ncbi:murein DD-endopeptidase MepM/ murein hydrolase activator NlpD [Saccharothrix australiensis]|uniref:Murein DD-endopeptidase MepM/ murein hydrolase activator NlpD n=1 Tax=Saccharothrix australiensis TaxID=2072 RepID=A0A495WA62_9PSEU|nr:M23 family metallopeptidase [Saccharothrix australiensis]RKT57655.1 murein DD-endopeptidase MepM/ murein hydrolase activator NlpD [Saccharothrix australiensis]